MKELSKELNFSEGLKAYILGCLSFLTEEGKIKWEKQKATYIDQPQAYGGLLDIGPRWTAKTEKLIITIVPEFGPKHKHINLVLVNNPDYYIEINDTCSDFKFRVEEIEDVIFKKSIRDEFLSIFDIGKK